MRNRGRFTAFVRELDCTISLAGREILKAGGLTPRGLLALAAHARRVEISTTELLNGGNRSHLDCRPGCTWCCRTSVLCTPLDVFLIAEWLRTHLGRRRYRSTVWRVRSAAAFRRDRSLGELLKIRGACPLLRRSRCVVYPVRPGVCVGWNSTDAKLCRALTRRAGGARPTRNGAILTLARVADEAAADALEECGGPRHEVVEFTQALLIALEDPLACAQWLGGKPVFQSCGLTWGEPLEWPLPPISQSKLRALRSLLARTNRSFSRSHLSLVKTASHAVAVT